MFKIRFFPIRCFGLNGKWVFPGRDLVVLGDGDLIALRSATVVDHCGSAVLGHEACATAHGMTREGGLQLRLPPGPVQHVRAGDMDPGKALSGLPLDHPLMRNDVVQVIGAIKMEGRIRVCRLATATRVHEVEI